MSEEKLYVIKSRSGDKFYFSGDRMIPNWSDNLVRLFGSYEVAKEIAEDNNGQPVTFVEEPEKVALTKEQSKIVEGAHNEKLPACYISSKSDDEELLMNAYVNGYTVAKEKKYNVKVPYANYKWYLKTPDGKLDTIFVEGLAKGFGGYPNGIELTNDDIEKFGLQDCEKEEVQDD